jgi:multidrug efflux system membrane fusion protein
MKILLPILLLLAGIAGAWGIVAHRPVSEPQTPRNEPPRVQAMRAEPQTLRLNVRSQGVVTPRTEIDLAPEVAGKIVQLHPGLAAGGFFVAGEVLLAIDPRDYDYAIAETRARIAEAKRQLASEEAEAEQARSEWQALGEGRPTPLTLHEPQLAEARAKLTAAEADLAQAQLRRRRCEWRAPFAGRVREKRVGLGQYVQPGDKLARLYSTDAAEVRLPVAADQLAYLDLPLARRDGKPGDGPKAILTAEFAGAVQRWEGRIVRTDGVLDEATGMLHAVAEVRDPYAPRNGRPPLLAGLFVQADIEGREQPGLFVLPRSAVNSSQEALLVDADAHLHIRRLEVLREEQDRVLVKAGLAAGDRVVTAGIQVPVEGMTVRLEAGEKLGEARAETGAKK